MAKLKDLVKRLEIVIGLLAVIIIALVVYIAYPALKTTIQGQPFGQRLSGINAQLSSYQLSEINNVSNSNFEIAGEKLLNISIPGEQQVNNSYTGPLFQVLLNHPPQYDSILINGKPSVIYIGAISCIYCGENRWAMALALSRFGSFSKLYTGYSSLGDGDLPTLYWVPQNITTKGVVTFGNYYSSKYINFYSAEYDSPITSGFQFPATTDPIQYFVLNATNSSYRAAMQFMNNTGMFEGTPFTFWGNSINMGATGVVFGNGTSHTAISNYPPLTYTTHQQVLDSIATFNSTFAYEEYAVADVYIAETCPAINNAAPVCSLPVIKVIESKMGL
ncbi:MAG: DUF929 family protein [Candidatus Micrarchaeaceae archaeon]|jgi:hypothetical protein